ncbi:MAG: hypothetical protein NTY38_06780 [Acidobacteria bacterium]|nr:hypothetical protein [Acidobacteriota bacterium]
MGRLLILMLIAGGCAVGICWGQPQTSRSLDLCTVAANIQTYSGHEVRITAFFGVGRENVVLYDPKCQDGKPMVWVEFKPKVAGQMKTLRRIVEKRHSALVTVDGTMHGGEAVKVDPKLPDWLKDRFKGSSQTYGHLGSFDMMMEVEKVVEAKEADDGIRPKAAADELHHEMQHAVFADPPEKKL